MGNRIPSFAVGVHDLSTDISSFSFPMDELFSRRLADDCEPNNCGAQINHLLPLGQHEARTASRSSTGTNEDFVRQKGL